MRVKSHSHEDIFIGLCNYSIPLEWESIGHAIKFSKDSFKVEEIINDDHISTSGYYLYKIVKSWGINSSDIERNLRKYSARLLGKKDKYSIAKQYVISEKPIRRPGYMYIGRVNKDIKTNELHIANKFDIMVRIRDSGKIDEIINRLEEIRKYPILNYFGYQRFGVKRRNHIVGYRIIKSVDRLHKFKWKIHRDILRLYVNAFQSYIFNHTLNQYVYPTHNLRAVERQKDGERNKMYFLQIGGIRVPSIPIIGYSMKKLPKYLEDIINKWGIQWGGLRRRLYELKRLGIDLFGSLRPVYIHFLEEPHVKNIHNETIEISFTILRGQYATIILREIFRPRKPRVIGY